MKFIRKTHKNLPLSFTRKQQQHQLYNEEQKDGEAKVSERERNLRDGNRKRLAMRAS